MKIIENPWFTKNNGITQHQHHNTPRRVIWKREKKNLADPAQDALFPLGGRWAKKIKPSLVESFDSDKFPSRFRSSKSDIHVSWSFLFPISISSLQYIPQFVSFKFHLLIFFDSNLSHGIFNLSYGNLTKKTPERTNRTNRIFPRNRLRFFGKLRRIRSGKVLIGLAVPGRQRTSVIFGDFTWWILKGDVPKVFMYKK